MAQSDIIRHPGRIDHIQGNHVRVRILASSGCASCHVKGACSMAEMEEKLVEIETESAQNYRVGQEILVEMDLATGTRAVVLGYVLPLALLLIVISAVYFTTEKDGLAGLSALLILIPYYLLLYYFRDRLKRKTVFTIMAKSDDY